MRAIACVIALAAHRIYLCITTDPGAQYILKCASYFSVAFPELADRASSMAAV